MKDKLEPCPICHTAPYLETFSVCPLHWEGTIYCPNPDCTYEADIEWSADKVGLYREWNRKARMYRLRADRYR